MGVTKKNGTTDIESCLYIDSAAHWNFWNTASNVLIESRLCSDSELLRQFLGKINHRWHFPMFSIQSTTVSQCPAKVFIESKILNAPILNL